jgi:hypothetical protein
MTTNRAKPWKQQIIEFLQKPLKDPNAFYDEADKLMKFLVKYEESYSDQRRRDATQLNDCPENLNESDISKIIQNSIYLHLCYEAEQSLSNEVGFKDAQILIGIFLKIIKQIGADNVPSEMFNLFDEDLETLNRIQFPGQTQTFGQLKTRADITLAFAQSYEKITGSKYSESEPDLTWIEKFEELGLIVTV